MAYVYILHSKTANRFYIGSCENLEKRLEDHASKTYPNSFTSNYDDWTLFCSSPNVGYQVARKVEAHIKNMKSRAYILNLSKYPEIIHKLILKYST